jgi:hypothetical protein
VVVLTHATIIASYLVPNLLLNPHPNPLTAVSNQLFLVSTAIIVGTGQRLAYRAQRRQISDQLTIEHTKKNLEEAHEQLKQLDRFKSEFFANITHELKTPLTMMLAPPEATNRLYRNNRDGTFTDVTEKAGVADNAVWLTAITLAGKVAWAFPWLQGGLSGYHDMNGNDETRWSLYLTRTFHSLTVLGEYAGGTDESAIGDVNSMAAFVEGVYRVSRGVNLRAKFDYVDPDRDRDRVLNRRYLVDLDVEPVPFAQIKLSYALYHPSTPTGLFIDSDEYVAMLYVPF